MRHIVVVAVVIAATFSVILSAQTASTEFAAVSVKRLPPGTPPTFQPSAGFRFSGPLLLLIHEAFRATGEWQYSGIPDWVRAESYEVVGAYPIETPAPTPAERRAMECALLVDRFKLQTHEESRDVPVYNLVMARDDRRLGKGLQGPLSVDCDAILAADAERARTTGQSPSPPAPGVPLAPCANRFRIPHLEGDVTMDVLATVVQGLLRQPVKNATGLTGYYRVDFTAGFDTGVSAAPANPDVPSPFTALPEQLGLKLERGRATFQVVVIDHIERASEN